jgi:CDP-glycerol glycerophosphotransferase (TagB/SpsB family)
VIQHGAPFEMVKMALAPVTCTKIAAWGSHSQELLREWGVPADKIEVTGAPRYDAFAAQPSSDSRQEVIRDFNLSRAKKMVIFAADPFHEPERADFVGNSLTLAEQRHVVHALIRIFTQMSDCQLIVKLHPRERYESFFQKWINEAGGGQTIRLARSYSTRKLLQSCDLLITVCSTVAIEALICKKPVITVNFSGGPDLQPHAEKGVALKAVHEEGLERAIRNAFSSPQNLSERREAVLVEYVGKLDGSSSRRVADLLEQLMNQSNLVAQDAA